LSRKFSDSSLYRPRYSAWKNNCDSLAVMGLHENWTLAPRFQVSGVRTKKQGAGRLGSLNARRLGSWVLGVGWVERGLV